MRFPPADVYAILLTEFASKLDGLLLFYLSSKKNIDRIAQTPWEAEGEDSNESRWRMKQVGAAVFSYTHALQELSLVGLAKTVEGTILLAQELTGNLFNIWGNDELGLPYHHEVRYVRALNNTVKHSRSVIADDGRQGSKFLVERWGHRYGDNVAYLELDIPRAAYRSYVFCDHFSAYVAGVHPSPIEANEESAVQRFKQDAIPDFIEDI